MSPVDDHDDDDDVGESLLAGFRMQQRIEYSRRKTKGCRTRLERGGDAVLFILWAKIYIRER